MSEHQKLTRPSTVNNAGASPTSIARQGTRSGGRTLDPPTQNLMSSRFGHDFSQVRIHNDAGASDSAQVLQAEAYTTGSDIVFQEGAFDPGSTEGQELLAHELTHVVQQKSGSGDPGDVSRRSDSSEQEAERAASQVMAGESVSVQAASSAGISRFGLNDYDPNPTPTLPDGPVNVGHKQDPNGEAGTYAYDNFNRFGSLGVPGFDFGAGVEATGSHKWDLGSGGQNGSVTAQGETGVGVKGNVGAWSDDGQNNRYGARVSSIGGLGPMGPMPGGSGSIKYDDGHGRSIGLEGQAGTAGAEASIGDDGATLGGGVTAVGGAINANDGHEGTRFGLSEGPSLAGRAHWGKDKDGYRNYGVGADFEIFSMDFTTNDPLRSMARHGLDPTGGLLADALLPDGNVTDKAAGLFDLTTKDADLGTTWDVAKSAAGGLYDGASDLASKAMDAGGQALDWGEKKAGEAVSGVGGAVNDAENWGAKTLSDAANGASDAASSAEKWGMSKFQDAATGASDAAGSAMNWGANKVSEAAHGASDAVSSAGDWGASKLGSAASGVSDAAGSAMSWGAGKAGEASGGVSNFIDQASKWSSVGDAASGLSDAASGAFGWMGDTAGQAASGATGAVGDAAKWAENTAGEAVSGVSGAVGDAAKWAGDAAGQAVSGATGAVGDAAKWAGNTASEAVSGAEGAVSDAAGWAGDKAGEAASGVSSAASKAASWLGDTASDLF